MRPKLDWRAVLSAGALCFAYTCAAAMPSAASAQDTEGTTPTATASKVGVSDRRLNVRMGRRAVVRGRIQPAGSTVALQVRRNGRWVTLDRDHTDAQGRYVLRDRMASPMSARARVRVSRGPAGKHGLGRLNVYRHALASWYGPGFYGRGPDAAAASARRSSASPTSRCRAGRGSPCATAAASYACR